MDMRYIRHNCRAPWVVLTLLTMKVLVHGHGCVCILIHFTSESARFSHPWLIPKYLILWKNIVWVLMCECPSHMHALAYRGLRLKLGVFLRGSPLDSLRRVFELYLELACSGDLLSLLPSILELRVGGQPQPSFCLGYFLHCIYLVCVPAHIFVCAYGDQRTTYWSQLSPAIWVPGIKITWQLVPLSAESFSCFISFS